MITADRIRTLYLFRHGQTTWNRDGRIQGHLDVPLAASGRTQAEGLRPHLKRLEIEAILSSDLCRAWETAELARPPGRIKIFRDARLRETFLGPIQGMTKEEIIHGFPDTKLMIEKGIRFPYLSDETVGEMGGERASSVIARARTAVEEFLRRTHYRRIGVSSHGGVIRRLLDMAENAPENRVPVPNACLYPIEIDLSKSSWRILHSLPIR